MPEAPFGIQFHVLPHLFHIDGGTGQITDVTWKVSLGLCWRSTGHNSLEFLISVFSLLLVIIKIVGMSSCFAITIITYTCSPLLNTFAHLGFFLFLLPSIRLETTVLD